MPEREPSTRERIVTEAVRLFAERGYRATTVGDIEAAAGLSPRRGSLYKHFKSKEDLLGAGLERHRQRMEAMETVVDLMPLGDMHAEFVLLVRWGLRELGRDRDLIRLVQKEGDHFPELRRYRDQLATFVFGGTAQWMRRYLEGTDIDVEATAAVVVGAVVHYRVEEAMWGTHPPGVDEERLVAALVRFWEALTGAQPGAVRDPSAPGS